MPSHTDIEILKRLRAEQSVKNINKQALEKARVVVNTQAKPFFDNAPKPSDFLLKEKRIVNNATFDERPRTIIEQNIPFSQPRSAREIVEANLGKDFFKTNKGLAVASTTQKDVSKGTRTKVNPIEQIFNNIFGGLFK